VLVDIVECNVPYPTRGNFGGRFYGLSNVHPLRKRYFENELNNSDATWHK